LFEFGDLAEDKIKSYIEKNDFKVSFLHMPKLNLHFRMTLGKKATNDRIKTILKDCMENYQ